MLSTECVLCVRMCSLCCPTENTCYLQKTHSIYRKRILSIENTFYPKRTHSTDRELILQNVYLYRTSAARVLTCRGVRGGERRGLGDGRVGGVSASKIRLFAGARIVWYVCHMCVACV
jgi:hypothetical protein